MISLLVRRCPAAHGHEFAVVAVAPRVNSIEHEKRFSSEQMHQLMTEGFTTFTDRFGKEHRILRKYVEERKHLKTIERCKLIHLPVFLIHGTSIYLFIYLLLYFE